MHSLHHCYKIYEESLRLLEQETSDPEMDPNYFKFKAKGLLLKTRDLALKELETVSPSNTHFDSYKATIAALTSLLGVCCLETDEQYKADEYFNECLASISDPLHPSYILVSIQVRNHLGFLSFNRSQLTEAEKWLKEAEALYETFKEHDGVPKGISEDKAEDVKKFEMSHTMTKFYLAQLYKALNDFQKSTKYCHETLKREILSQEYDPIDCALNSATLSQVFMEKGLFKQARHHLAAASYVLDTYENSPKYMMGTQEERDAKKEELCHRSADVSRCWAKYGIFLLEHSKNCLSSSAEESEIHKDFENLWFDLDLSIYENQIADSDVVAFEDAREVFLITQKHLNKAKEYYTLKDRASDHVQIVQDHSQLFRHLTAFEPDKERQFKMMKKRVDMLKVVLKELNPRYYLDVCRQLWFELGETYHDMMQIKFQKVQESKGMPEPQELIKINSLAETSACNFDHFLDSVRDKKTKELPDPLPEELTGPTLIAHFYLGRLHYKYITQDTRKKIENTKKAYDCFKYLVDSCEKSEKVRNVVGEEFNISKEMMTLLQMKVLQL